MIKLESKTHDLEKFIKEKGLRFGRARKIIADIIVSTNIHMTPSKIAEKARSVDSKISLASVYRTIQILKKAGLVAESRFLADGEAYIEPMGGRPHHDHLFCIKCGEIIEFQNQQIEKLQVQIAKSHGYKIVHHSHLLWGLCKTCRSNKHNHKSNDMKMKLRIY